MRITLLFTETLDLHPANKYETRTIIISLPDEASQVPDAREKVLALGQGIGALTQAVLHLTCRALDINDMRVNQMERSKFKLRFHYACTILRFERETGLGKQTHDLIIPSAAELPGPANYPTKATGYQAYRRRGRDIRGLKRVKSKRLSEKTLHSLDMNLIRRMDWSSQTGEQAAYVAHIKNVIALYLALANAEQTPAHIGKWTFVGFHPSWKDDEAYKAKRRWDGEQKRIETQAAKHTPTPSSTPQIPTPPQESSSQRRPGGAVPGKFGGIMYRSQLEIRFATQLAKRGIRWEYEPERLGDAQYLVDFYLPDLKVWVEVKGQFEARDDLILPETATFLERERHERLFVYAGRKTFSVDGDGFSPLTSEAFWQEIGGTDSSSQQQQPSN